MSIGILRMLGLRSYIKISGKSFRDLHDAELGSMIDAYLTNGNDDFEQNALTEFTLMNYKETRLRAFKSEILEIQQRYCTHDQPDGLSSHDGVEALRKLQIRLSR